MKYLVCLALLLATSFAQTDSHAKAEPSLTAKQPAKQKVLWQKLESSIRDVDDHLDGVMGVAIEDLKTGDQLFLHEDEVFAQASSIKIAVLANLYLQVQQGKLKSP